MKKLIQKHKLIISWALVIIWMIVIFSLSAMDGLESNTKSKGTINTAITKAAEVSNNLGVTAVNTESPKKLPIIDKLNTVLRKGMHASVYFVLYILVFNALKASNISNKKAYIIAILFVFLYACTDEYHQTFVAGRTRTVYRCAYRYTWRHTCLHYDYNH